MSLPHGDAPTAVQPKYVEDDEQEEEEEKSEGNGGSLHQDPTFWDSEGLADVSVTAEESAVMADISEHKSKKKAKKKKKKISSKTKSRRRSRSHHAVDGTPSELSADEGTDIEAAERPRRPKKSKSKQSRKKDRSKRDRDRDSERSDVESPPMSTAEFERKSKVKKERIKKSSKSKKKTKKRKKSTKVSEDAGELVAPSTNAPVDGTEGVGGGTAAVFSEDAGFPPDLDSDSSSSDLPDPSDLDVDDSSEYESDRSGSSIDFQVRQVSHVPSLLGESREPFPREMLNVELSASSIHSVSLPPQTIPGSLANEVVAPATEQFTNEEDSESVQKVTRKCKGWNCWTVATAAVLLVVVVVLVVVLTTRDNNDSDPKESSPQAPSPAAAPSTTRPQATPTVSMAPSFQFNWTIDSQPLAEKLGINASDTVVFEDQASVDAFNWLLDEDWPLESTPDSLLRDRYALAAFYYATGGDQWQINQFWLSSQDVCQWHGIVCDSFNAVEWIVLNENGLSNSLPTELSLLTSLIEIDLGMNTIGFDIPTQIGLLTSLSRLALTESRFSGNIPTELGSLSSLVSLNLAGNFLSSTFPNEVAELTQLEFFDISNNKLSGSLPSQVGSMTSLNFLNISNNVFDQELPSEIGLLTGLIELNGGSNSFVGTMPTEFGLLAELTALRLNSNEIQGAIPTSLGGLSALVDLALDDNLFSGEIPAVFRLLRLRGLNVLLLHDNLLTGDLDSIVCFQSSSVPTIEAVTADCSGPTPEVICSCCTSCF